MGYQFFEKGRNVLNRFSEYLSEKGIPVLMPVINKEKDVTIPFAVDAYINYCKNLRVGFLNNIEIDKADDVSIKNANEVRAYRPKNIEIDYVNSALIGIPEANINNVKINSDLENLVVYGNIKKLDVDGFIENFGATGKIYDLSLKGCSSYDISDLSIGKFKTLFGYNKGFEEELLDASKRYLRSSL